MRQIARRLMAICLTVVPSASAAYLRVPAAPAAVDLAIPDGRHGLDWNVFTLPTANPLAYLDEPRRPGLEALALGPRAGRQSTDASELERRAFNWIVFATAALLLAMRAIPRVHAWRAHFRALALRLPLH